MVNVWQQGQSFVIHCKREVVLLALPVVRFLSKEKNVPVGMFFLLQKMLQKAAMWRNSRFFSNGVQYVPQNMPLLSFSSFTMSQPWPNILATSFFSPPSVLSLPSSSPFPSAFILLRSAMLAEQKRKQMALSCVFFTLWWKDLVPSYLSIKKVKLKLITIIRNAGLQLPGFKDFLISL